MSKTKVFREKVDILFVLVLKIILQLNKENG